MSYFAQWHDEKQSAWLYRTLAGNEVDPEKKHQFAALADAAESHAQQLEWQVTNERGNRPRHYRPSLRLRLAAHLLPRLSDKWAQFVVSILQVGKVPTLAGHMEPPGHPVPTPIGQSGQSAISVTAGSNLRAAVFGINDGLVSNTSLIMGVAGATTDMKAITISGIAGLLAGAFSMAAGEFVSMRSQRDLYEKQIRRERDEIARFPEEETEELAMIYHNRGLPLPQARGMATAMMQDPQQALDTHVREELGLNPDDLGSPAGAAVSSFLSFAIGGFVPLLPFLLPATMRAHAIPLSAVLASLALFSTGVLVNLLTGHRLWWGGLRMLLIGGSAGVITYLIGTVLGVSMT